MSGSLTRLDRARQLVKAALKDVRDVRYGQQVKTQLQSTPLKSEHLFVHRWFHNTYIALNLESEPHI